MGVSNSSGTVSVSREASVGSPFASTSSPAVEGPGIEEPSSFWIPAVTSGAAGCSSAFFLSSPFLPFSFAFLSCSNCTKGNESAQPHKRGNH